MKNLILILTFISFSGWATASPHPLAALDTSSPRALLTGYLLIVTDIYQQGMQVLKAYRESDRLFMTADEREALYKIKDEATKLMPAFDFSVLPAVTREESKRRVIIELKEVLDRATLPPMGEVPDAKTMRELGKTRWQIPNTEIAIQQIESGDRKGDYIFAPDSIERLSEIYARSKALPYITTTTTDWYERQLQYPVGPMLALVKIVPTRWVLNDFTMATSKITFLNQPLWRWLGIFLLALFLWISGRSVFRWVGRLRERHEDPLGFLALIRPLALALLFAVAARILTDVLRVSDAVFLTVIPSFWALFFIALSWFFWNVGDVVAESIIASERMIKGSTNSQLVRFLMRLITFTMVIATLVIGGQSLGLPAYSIIASIGVGGLAVALAAQQTLANLLASLIIMFEKPFVIGSRVIVSGQTGKVTSIGFRSTQIEADGGAVISIPNDKVISGPIHADNTRPQNHVSATLRVPTTTAAAVIRQFVAQARDHLIASCVVQKSSVNVGVSGLTPEGVEIHLEFILTGPFGERVAERKNEILLELLEIGAQSQILGSNPVICSN